MVQIAAPSYGLQSAYARTTQRFWMRSEAVVTLQLLYTPYMKQVIGMLGLCFLALASSCQAQQPFGDSHLQMLRTILLPHVRGRIDHMDIDTAHHIVFISALGNNTLEVVHLETGAVLASIRGLSEPQGVAYLPLEHEICVANGGTGAVDFFNAETYKKTATLHLGSDADDVRYDPETETVYVGYGEGGIARIQARTHRLVETFALPAHPESFQVDRHAGRIYVNLPDAHLIDVLDLNHSSIITAWRRNLPRANFPMALDAPDHRLFIGYRFPPRLEVVNAATGATVSELPMTRDADDMYYDAQTKRLYVSGGGGQVDIFQQLSPDRYHQLAAVPTRDGARTSLLIPDQSLFLLAERAESGKPAQLLVFKTQ